MTGIWWLLASLLPFLVVQRWLQREIQTLFLILSRRPVVAVGLFSLLFLPGVFLHEASHYLMATVLGVRTGRFSLLPRPLPGGRLQMGFVETSPSDILRDALIGSAPLFSGAAVIAYLSYSRLGLLPAAGYLAQMDWRGLFQALAGLPGQQDFWLWFYLAFAVSSTMLPSPSDRRAWLPLLLAAGALTGIAALAGAGAWMLETIAPWVDKGMQAMAVLTGVCLAIHLVLVFPITLLRVFFARLTGFGE